MEINGNDDHFARWLQGLCAIPLFGAILVVIWLLHQLTPNSWRARMELVSLLVFLNVLLARCVWYAITGTGNINRDVLDNIDGNDLDV